MGRAGTSLLCMGTREGGEMAEIKPLEHWRRLDELEAGLLEKLAAAEPRRFFLVRVDRPAYAPFPARALRDRPWDISALVEE